MLRLGKNQMAKRAGRKRGLFDSERRFRILVQGVTDYAIYMLDPSGIITNWNAGAERIKGYTADEIVGQHIQPLLRPGRSRSRPAGAWAGDRGARRPLIPRPKGGGYARTAANSGQPSSPMPIPRRQGEVDWLRQNHARHHRTAEGRGLLAGKASVSSVSSSTA